MIGGLRARRGPLASRLRAHVVSEFDRADHGWWASRASGRPLPATTRLRAISWHLRARRRRNAELEQVVEHLAVVITAGCALSVAMDRVVERGRGPVVDELAIVGGWMRDGQPAARALRRWSMVTACDTTGRLAAAVTSTTSSGELGQRLHVLAHVLRQRVHDERLAAMQRAARVAWTACVLAIVAWLAATLP